MLSLQTACFVNLEDLDEFLNQSRSYGWNKRKRQKIGVVFQEKSGFVVHFPDEKTD